MSVEKTYFGMQVSNRGNRNCSHCFVDSCHNGPLLSFENIKKIVPQIAEIVYLEPEKYFKIISLTGGEFLQYKDGNFDAGDVLDVIHECGLEIVLNTRGWTDSERKNRSLTYQNFNKIAQRFPLKYSPTIEISFDSYTFNGDGFSERAQKMAQNTINGFRKLTEFISLHSTVSRESLPPTIRAIKKMMRKCQYKLIEISDVSKHLLRESVHVIAGAIIAAYYRKNEIPKLLFEHNNGHRISVNFYNIVLDGRAAFLNETPMKTFQNCMVAINRNNFFNIRCDMNVVPCCSVNYMEIPPIDSLQTSSLKDVLGQYEDYSRSVRAMQENVKDELVRQNRDICTVCAKELPKFLSNG